MTSSLAPPRLGLQARFALAGAVVLALLTAAMVAGLGAQLRHDAGREREALQAAMLDERARQIEDHLVLRRDALLQHALQLSGKALPNPQALEAQLGPGSLLGELFDAVLVSDADGVVVFDSPELPGRRGMRAPPALDFAGQLRAPAGTVIGPTVARTSDDRVITFIAPVLSPSGRPTGLLAASLFLSRARAQRIFGPANAGPRYFSLVTREAAPRVLMASPALAPSAAGEWLGRQRPIAGVPWVLGVAERRDEALADERLRERRLLLAALAGWLAASGGLWCFVGVFGRAARRQRQPLEAEVQRLQRVLQHAPAAICTLDAGLRILDWNHQAELTFGWRREQVLGQSAVQLMIPAPQHEAVLQRFAGHLAQRDGLVLSDDVEIEALHRDGRCVPVALSAATTGPAGGRQTTVFLRDISSRLAAQEELRTSERRLRMITDNMPALIGYADAGQRYRFINRNLGHIGGFETQTLIGRTLLESMGAEPYAVARPHIEAALRGQRARFEIRSTTELNRVYQVDYIPDQQDDGPVCGIYMMLLDVSAERQTQARLALSERRLREITDNVPGLILCLTPDQEVSFCNRAVGEWLGVAPERLLGRHLSLGLGHTVYAQWAAPIERTLQGEDTKFEVVLPGAGGERHLQTVLVPHRGEDGAVTGLYALSTDVTAMKSVERQLQALARFDPLTGLPNRRQLDERLAEALSRSQRTRQAVALMVIDLDHFKAINDGFGHAVGDAVLKEAAARLGACVRGTDMVARVGGDEFVAVLEGLHALDEAGRVASKSVNALRRPFEIGGQTLAVTVSIGAVFHAGTAPADAAELTERADRLLYDVKAEGRDGYRLALF